MGYYQHFIVTDFYVVRGRESSEKDLGNFKIPVPVCSGKHNNFNFKPSQDIVKISVGTNLMK